MFGYNKRRNSDTQGGWTGRPVPGCNGLSTMVRSLTYAVLSRNQSSRELRAHGQEGSQKVTSDDEGEGEGGGPLYPPKTMT